MLEKSIEKLRIRLEIEIDEGQREGLHFCCKDATIAALVGQSVHTSASSADSLPGACEMLAARCCSRLREKRARNTEQKRRNGKCSVARTASSVLEVLTTHSDDDVRRYRGNTGSRLKYRGEGPLMKDCSKTAIFRNFRTVLR